MNEAKETFYIFDLDRTLFDTVGGSEELIGLIRQHSAPAAQEVLQRLDELIATKASFSIRDLVAELLGEQDTQHIFDTFVHTKNPERLLLPGAKELMQFAEITSSGWGILTYGSVRGQMAKLGACGLDAAQVIVTDQRDKGALMRGWQQDDGSFALPQEYGRQTADDLVFVDDRIFSFDGMPSEVTGYWVTEDVSVLDSIEHARSVHPVSSLKEVLENEQHRRQIDKA